MRTLSSILSLAGIRRAANLSQEDAARKAMVSLATWKNWERARACPSVRKYPDIAKALGVSVQQVQDAVREIETAMLKRGAA